MEGGHDGRGAVFEAEDNVAGAVEKRHVRQLAEPLVDLCEVRDQKLFKPGKRRSCVKERDLCEELFPARWVGSCLVVERDACAGLR